MFFVCVVIYFVMVVMAWAASSRLWDCINISLGTSGWRGELLGMGGRYQACPEMSGDTSLEHNDLAW